MIYISRTTKITDEINIQTQVSSFQTGAFIIPIPYINNLINISINNTLNGNLLIYMKTLYCEIAQTVPLIQGEITPRVFIGEYQKNDATVPAVIKMSVVKLIDTDITIIRSYNYSILALDSATKTITMATPTIPALQIGSIIKLNDMAETGNGTTRNGTTVTIATIINERTFTVVEDIATGKKTYVQGGKINPLYAVDGSALASQPSIGQYLRISSPIADLFKGLLTGMTTLSIMLKVG